MAAGRSQGRIDVEKEGRVRRAHTGLIVSDVPGQVDRGCGGRRMKGRRGRQRGWDGVVRLIGAGAFTSASACGRSDSEVR